jgi:hypothetical protein
MRSLPISSGRSWRAALRRTGSPTLAILILIFLLPTLGRERVQQSCGFRHVPTNPPVEQINLLIRLVLLPDENVRLLQQDRS